MRSYLLPFFFVVVIFQKKQMGSYLLPFFITFAGKTNGMLSITFFCVIFAENNITLSRSAPYI